MPALEKPSAMSARTSRSRGVSSRNGSLARGPDELRDDAWIQGGPAGGHPPDGVGELVGVRDAVLEEIADALGGLGDQVHGVGRLEVLREDEDRGARVSRADLERGAQALVGVG